jgi:hypothetical protein
MEDESRSQPLSRRVPGAARAAPPPLVRTDLPPSVLQRMQAAIDAARAEAAARDQDHDQGHDPVTEPLPLLTKSGAVSGGATSPAANGADVQRSRAAKSKRMARRDRAATPRDTAELDQSAASQSAAAERSEADMLPKRGVQAKLASEPRPAAEPDTQPKPSPEPESGARQEQTMPPEHATLTRQPADLPATSRRAARVRAPASVVRAPAGRRAHLRTSWWQEAGRRFGKPHVIAAAVVVIAAGSLAIALSIHGAPSARIPASAGLKRQEATTRSLAAAWIAQQVSRNAIVSCDQQMCSALVAKGFPKGNVQVLGPMAPYPVTSALVIETASIRSVFGTRLNSDYAPAVIASFGSGNALITIRVIAPHGPVAYENELKVYLQNGKENSAALLHSSQNLITTSPQARSQLASGDVDSRLLVVIAALATKHPVDIVQFGNVASGASAGVPLRYADLAENFPAAHLPTAAYVRSVLAILKSVPAPYSPAYARTVLIDGDQPVLRIEFTAPSPLTILGPAPP